MNTIEQAQKVSTQLAERARRLSRTLRMRPRVGLEEESADTIDALLAELEKKWQQGFQMGTANNLRVAKDVIDELRREQAAHRETNRLMTEALLMAEAELDALKSQEPVAVNNHYPHMHMVGPTDGGYTAIEEITYVPVGAKLYLAAGAQTIAASYQLVPVEPTKEMIVALMCTGLRHAEYKRGCDPTLTHMEQGYKAMLAAAKEQP